MSFSCLYIYTHIYKINLSKRKSIFLILQKRLIISSSSHQWRVLSWTHRLPSHLELTDTTYVYYQINFIIEWCNRRKYWLDYKLFEELIHLKRSSISHVKTNFYSFSFISSLFSFYNSRNHMLCCIHIIISYFFLRLSLHTKRYGM